jgi:hypothetical protein
MTIFKYPLQFAVKQEVTAPIVAPLTIQMQGDVPCLWAQVTERQPDEKTYEIIMVGTGTKDLEENFCQPREYLETTQSGGFVYHWFVREKKMR